MGRHLLLAQRPNSVLGVWRAEFLLMVRGGSVCLVQLQQLLAILGTALLEAGSPSVCSTSLAFFSEVVFSYKGTVILASPYPERPHPPRLHLCKPRSQIRTHSELQGLGLPQGNLLHHRGFPWSLGW